MKPRRPDGERLTNGAYSLDASMVMIRSCRTGSFIVLPPYADAILRATRPKSDRACSSGHGPLPTQSYNPEDAPC
jgi:hypothetical protein